MGYSTHHDFGGFLRDWTGIFPIIKKTILQPQSSRGNILFCGNFPSLKMPEINAAIGDSVPRIVGIAVETTARGVGHWAN